MSRHYPFFTIAFYEIGIKVLERKQVNFDGHMVYLDRYDEGHVWRQGSLSNFLLIFKYLLLSFHSLCTLSSIIFIIRLSIYFYLYLSLYCSYWSTIVSHICSSHLQALNATLFCPLLVVYPSFLAPVRLSLSLSLTWKKQLITGTNKRRRTEQGTILYAYQKWTNDKSEQNKTIFLINNVSLYPFTISDYKGNEDNALTHGDIVKRHSSLQSIVPMKRQHQQDHSRGSHTLCINCSLYVTASLQELFATSSYTPLMTQREYIPLTDEMCELMNRDWWFYPQAKYYTAAILSGSILLNTRNNQAVMINTVKLYGRTKVINGHREPFGKLKDGVHVTSLPLPPNTIHPDIWSVLLSRNDGPKLTMVPKYQMRWLQQVFVWIKTYLHLLALSQATLIWRSVISLPPRSLSTWNPWQLLNQ